MTERLIEGQPSALPAMLKAALPVIPGVNQIPGVAKKGGDLPDLRLTRKDVAVDAEHLAAYREVCGFAPGQHLPLTYPHMLAFSLHMGIMTDSAFPYAAIGSVHLRNSMTQHRLIAPSEHLDVTATATNKRGHSKGTIFDFVTTVSVAGADEVVWESVSTYLRPGRSDKEAKPEGEPFDVVPGNGTTWKLAGDLGRRFAAVSGDYNPIHLYPLTAKAFGFPSQIAHGIWTKARCVAAMESRIPDAATVEVEFKKPVLLPTRVAFGSRIVEGGSRGGLDNGLDFSMTNPKNGKPHVVGRVR
ncbi:MAG: Acyl dehydratase [Marmoricola sp.]|nr:Acyl dehydratase [Marmoricola sp.]